MEPTGLARRELRSLTHGHYMDRGRRRHDSSARNGGYEPPAVHPVRVVLASAANRSIGRWALLGPLLSGIRSGDAGGRSEAWAAAPARARRAVDHPLDLQPCRRCRRVLCAARRDCFAHRERGAGGHALGLRAPGRGVRRRQPRARSRNAGAHRRHSGRSRPRDGRGGNRAQPRSEKWGVDREWTSRLDADGGRVRVRPFRQSVVQPNRRRPCALGRQLLAHPERCKRDLRLLQRGRRSHLRHR